MRNKTQAHHRVDRVAAVDETTAVSQCHMKWCEPRELQLPQRVKDGWWVRGGK